MAQIMTSPRPAKMDCEQAKSTLRIAVVYGRTPLPMRRADQMTVAHLLAFLKARGHQVDLFYIDTGGTASSSDRQWLASVCNQVHVYNLDRLSLIRSLLRVITHLVPVQVGLFSHPRQMAEVRRRVVESNYDIVYTYYFRSAEITRDLGFKNGTAKDSRDGKPATYIAMQLSQTLNTSRIAKNAPNLLLKWFYEFESRLVARYEARIWQHFTKSVLIGRSDVEAVSASCVRFGLPPISNYVYGAHGTDVSRFTPRTDIPIKPDHLVFSGVMRTPTNVQATQWFARNVWPLVKAARPSATWAIVGREPTSEVQKLGALPGVTVTGTVLDPAAQIAEAAVCINPMQAGGGMQNKLIEYMASAKPVVATSVANEGIGAPSDTLVVADAPEDFAAAIILLLENPGKAQEIANNARAYVLKNWTWEAHFLKLEDEFYSSIK